MDMKTAQDKTQLATSIFNSLVSRRLMDKYRASELLNHPKDPIDLVTLKILLTKAITKDYYVGKEIEQDDVEIAGTRSWLLRSLAFISASDDEATNLAVKHLDSKYERNYWTRYWVLEGLISGKNSKAEALASEVVKSDNHRLVVMLANAFLASRKDQEAAEKIRKELEDSEDKWAVLRALRIVPLPSTVPALCQIVESAGYADWTYDAIIAVGSIPNEWNQSIMAGQALSTCIIKMRGSPWQDSMRTAAITGLGNLMIESAAPLIIEELADDNPAIVREAARSLEKILGLPLTVVRIVESAAKSGTNGIDIYARALRWLNRDVVAEELETLMTTGAARQQEVARTLLSEVGGTVAFEKLRARTDIMKQYTDMLEQTESKIRELFEASVHDAQRGFDLALIMDVAVFVLGIILLLGSATYALTATGNLATWAGIGISGGLGVLGILYGVLISNPRRQVRESVDHLMLLKIVFLAYLRRLHQADQAYTRRILDDEPIDAEQVKLFADMVGHIMADTIEKQSKGNSRSSSTQESKAAQE